MAVLLGNSAILLVNSMASIHPGRGFNHVPVGWHGKTAPPGFTARQTLTSRPRRSVYSKPLDSRIHPRYTRYSQCTALSHSAFASSQRPGGSLAHNCMYPALNPWRCSCQKLVDCSWRSRFASWAFRSVAQTQILSLPIPKMFKQNKIWLITKPRWTLLTQSSSNQRHFTALKRCRCPEKIQREHILVR